MDFYTKLLKWTSRLFPINLALPPSTHLRPACGSQGPQGTGVELVSSWGFISRSTRYSNRQQRAAQRDALQYKKAGAPVDNGPRQNSKAFRLPSPPSGLSPLQHTLCHRDVLLKIPAPSGDSSTSPVRVESLFPSGLCPPLQQLPRVPFILWWFSQTSSVSGPGLFLLTTEYLIPHPTGPQHRSARELLLHLLHRPSLSAATPVPCPPPPPTSTMAAIPMVGWDPEASHQPISLSKVGVVSFTSISET